MSKSAKRFSRRHHAPTYEKISRLQWIDSIHDHPAAERFPMRRLLADRLALATGVTVILMSLLFALLRVAG
jgi:hypothetical protein